MVGEWGVAKSPLDRALDLFVYAPLGVALTARDKLPELVDKGRERFTGQVNTARIMGEMAVTRGQREAEKAVSEAVQRLADLGWLPAESGSERTVRPEEGDEAPLVSPSGDGGPEPVTVSAEGLAIPGYDALSAPQVVQRLAGLSSDELEAVRAYEAGTRHRKTILTRISQLQSDQP